MMTNPWSLMAPSEDRSAKSLAAIGQKALESGMITPEQAQEHLNDYYMQTQGQEAPPAAAPMAAPGAPPQPAPTRMGEAAKLTANYWKQKSAEDDTSKRQSSLNRVLRTSPEEYAQLEKMAMDSPGYKRQEAGIDQLDKMLRMNIAYSPNQVDMAPLQNLANFVTGKNVPAPEARRPEWDKIMGWAGDIQKRRGDLTKTIKDSIAQTKAGTLQDLWLAQQVLKGEGQVGVAEPKPGNNKPQNDADKFLKTFRTDKTVIDITNATNAIRNMDVSFKTNSWVGDQNLRAQLVNAAGLKPISDTDIAQYSGSQAVQQQLMRIRDKVNTGAVFTQDDRDAVRKYADLQRVKLEGAMREAAENHADGLGPDFGYTREHALRILKPAIASPSLGMKYSQPATPPPAEKSIAQQIIEGMTKAKGMKTEPAPAPSAEPTVQDKIKKFMKKGN